MTLDVYASRSSDSILSKFIGHRAVTILKKETMSRVAKGNVCIDSQEQLFFTLYLLVAKT